MHSHTNLQRILVAQPLSRMQQFAELLGWRGLRLEYVTLGDDEAACANVPGGVVIFYQTTDDRFNLQINTFPHGQLQFHEATIIAERYGIRCIGWHRFELFEDDAEMREEATRVRPWLDRRIFRDAKRRRQFISEHPEVVS